MGKKLFVLATCLAVILFISTTSMAGEIPKEIHIGATVSQSGHFSSEIGPFERLMKARADIVNADGGIMVKSYNKKLPVKFTIYDERSD